jgi:hypothetical protein
MRRRRAASVIRICFSRENRLNVMLVECWFAKSDMKKKRWKGRITWLPFPRFTDKIGRAWGTFSPH